MLLMVYFEKILYVCCEAVISIQMQGMYLWYLLTIVLEMFSCELKSLETTINNVQKVCYFHPRERILNYKQK